MAWVNATPERLEAAHKRARQWRSDNPERFREKCDRWREENPDKYRETMQKAYAKYRRSEKGQAKRKAHVKQRTESGLGAAYKRKRDASKLQATPPWFDPDLVKPIYEQAAVLTEVTGQRWEVDHIDPLQGELVCGLHVAENLTAITRSENRAKKNRFTPYRIDAAGEFYELFQGEWRPAKA